MMNRLKKTLKNLERIEAEHIAPTFIMIELVTRWINLSDIDKKKYIKREIREKQRYERDK